MSINDQFIRLFSYPRRQQITFIFCWNNFEEKVIFLKILISNIMTNYSLNIPKPFVNIFCSLSDFIIIILKLGPKTNKTANYSSLCLQGL